MSDQLYEIHLSVKTDDIEYFRDVCQCLSVKPIIIDLQDSSGEHQMQDVMTSGRVKGTLTDAYERAAVWIDHLVNDHSLAVVRTKIETTIDNPIVPTSGVFPSSQYFEAHFAVTTEPWFMDGWASFAEHYGMHLSRNPFKKLPDGRVVQMMTLRAYSGTATEFDKDVSFIKNDFHPTDEVRVEREFVLYDSNRAHEGSWGIAA